MFNILILSATLIITFSCATLFAQDSDSSSEKSYWKQKRQERSETRQVNRKERQNLRQQERFSNRRK